MELLNHHPHPPPVPPSKSICLRKTPQPALKPKSEPNKKRFVKQIVLVVVYRKFTATTSKRLMAN